jgi:DNA-binding NarL/FixJ family response regulator
LIVSRAKKLLPYYKKRLEELGFKDVEATGEEKDSLNMAINELKPRLVLMSSKFYQAGTPYMTGRLVKDFPEINIAAVSLGDFPDDIAPWFIWSGAKSYISLWEGMDEFYYGIQEIRKGREYISPAVQKLMGEFLEWPEIKTKVTKRYMEVIVLLCNGFLPDDIGEELHIKRNTVTSDLKKIYRMFHVNNREGMVAVAWVLGLVTIDDMRFYKRNMGDTVPLPGWAAVKTRLSKRSRE